MIRRLALALACVGLAAPAAAEDAGKLPPPVRKRVTTATPGLITPETQRAIDRGLEALARMQKSDGSFGSGQYAGNVAVTGIAGLAFLASGSNPGEGKYAEHIDRALEYCLKHTSPSGFVCNLNKASHGPMYDHGFGTLFLSECYGMSRRPELREKVKKAVQLIVNTQNHEGGWRYQPKREPQADTSVTICQIMALRSARNSGIHVPKSAAERCADYIRKCQNPDGGFRYMASGGPSAFPRSAAGVVTFYTAGVYEGKELERGLDYLSANLDGGDGGGFGGFGGGGGNVHYFYGRYYAVHALYQAGGKRWAEGFPALRDELLERARRNGDGSWTDQAGADYATAMALIVLQTPLHLLPIFQH